MAGALVKVVPKTNFSWSSFYNSAAGANVFPLGDPIETLQFTTAVLVVRFHNLQIDSIGTNMTVGLYPDYIDDPGSSGFGVSPTVSVFVDKTAVAPLLFIGGAPMYSQYASVGLTLNYSTGQAVADISVDVCLRNPDDTRTAMAVDLGTLLMNLGVSPPRFRQRALHLFEQLLEPWALDLGSVGFVIEPIAPGFLAKALSEKIVAVSPALVGSRDRGQILAAIAHELSHVAQIRLLGWGPAARRATREAGTYGEIVARMVPTSLTGKESWEIDPVDARFTLEAISGRMGEIARGWATL
jgi:hypothetical protein